MRVTLKHFFILVSILGLTNVSLAQKTKEYTDASSLFEHGKMLYLKKQYVPAIKEFQSFLGTTPGPNFEYEANAYIGLSRLKLDKNGSSRNLSRFVRKNPEHKLNTEIGYELGIYYFNKRKYRTALKYLEAVNDKDVTKAQREELSFKKGYSYFKNKEYARAKTEFKKIMNGDGEYSIEANYYYGYQCYILKDYQCALSTFNKIGNKGPKTMQLYTAQIYYEQEKYEEAFDAIKGIKIAKRKNEIELLIGKIQYQLGNKSLALRHFDNYGGDVDAFSPDEIYQFANANFEAGRMERATKFFVLISNNDNEIGQAANYHLGVSDVKNGKKDRALNAFAEAKRKDFNKDISEEAAFNYAKLAAELQKNSIAINAIKEFLDVYPRSEHNDEAKSIMAEVFLSTKNYKAAIEVLEGIRQLNNTSKAAYQELTFHRAEELYLNSEYKESEKYFLKSLRYPKDKTLEAMAYFWRAEIAYKDNNYNESLNLMNRFISNAGSNTSKNKEYGYYGMGYNYFKKKDYTKAQNYFAKFKERTNYATSNKAIYLDNSQRLADCYFINRQYNNAIKEYDVVIRNKYKNADYSIFQKGMLYGLQERHSEKIRTLKLIQKDFPRSVYIDDALYQIAREYMVLENYSMAQSIFNLLISQHDYSQFLPDSYLKLGLINRNQGKDNAALRYFKTVVERFPKTNASKEALSLIEIIYTDQGNPEKYFEYAKDVPGANVSLSYQDSVMYSTAISKYVDGDCPGATRGFRKYISQFSDDGYFIIQANYYKAECDYFNNKENEALKHYKYVVTQNRNEFTEKSLIRLSTSYYKRKDYKASLDYFTELEPLASTSNTFINALMGQIRCNYYLKNYSLAKKKAIELLPVENVPTEDLVEANMILGRIQLKDNNLRTAKSHFDYVIEKSRNALTAEALYQRAVIFYEQDELKNSREDIYTINEDFSAYEIWVVKGFILLSDIYVKEKDYFQAKATLQSIIDNYEKDDGILDICKMKLKEVEDLENPEEVIEPEEE